MHPVAALFFFSGRKILPLDEYEHARAAALKIPAPPVPQAGSNRCHWNKLDMGS
jgi:hypothetical protein